MPLDEDQVAAVKKLVWSGMHSRSRIVEILTEELYYPQGGG